MKKYFFLILLSFTVDFYAVHAATVSSSSIEDSIAEIISHNEKINLNTADIARLTGSFKRIGKKHAEAIVRYRKEHGYFTSVAQLSQVRGLGVSFVSRYLSQLQATFSVE